MRYFTPVTLELDAARHPGKLKDGPPNEKRVDYEFLGPESTYEIAYQNITSVDERPTRLTLKGLFVTETVPFILRGFIVNYQNWKNFTKCTKKEVRMAVGILTRH